MERKTGLEFSTITKEQLKEKLDRGERLQLIDVRGRNAYLNEHIRGAFSLPYDRVPDFAQELLNPGTIVLYGADDRDLHVRQAAEALVAGRFAVSGIMLFPDGLTGWRSGGYFTTGGEESLHM